MNMYKYFFLFFFFNDTATTEIYTLSLHDALPIYVRRDPARNRSERGRSAAHQRRDPAVRAPRGLGGAAGGAGDHRVRRRARGRQMAVGAPALKVWSAECGMRS